MKIKSLIYLSLVIVLFLSLNFLKTKQVKNQTSYQAEKLIERLKITDPNDRFTTYFMILDNSSGQNTGTLYKIFDKTVENTFKLKSKPNYTRPILSKNKLELPTYGYEDEKFENINIVSIEVLENLLRNLHDFTYSMTNSGNSPKYPDLISMEFRANFSRYVLGGQHGADFLLRSILILFILMIGTEYFMNWMDKLSKRKNYFNLFSPIGLILGFRILASFEVDIYPDMFFPFLVTFIELLLLGIPFLIFKYSITKISLSLDFTDTELVKALLMFIIGITFLYVTHFILVNFVTRELVGDTIFEHDYSNNSISILHFGILPLLALMIANAFHNTYNHLLNQWRENRKTAGNKTLILETEAKLNEIQSSVNPHFLYNSFNSVAALAKKDPDKTEQMTLALSSFYKYTTNRRGRTYSTIKEELDMIRNYLEIEKVRFGDRLTYDIEVNNDLLDRKLPYFMLQPIVENAIKYGYDKTTDTIAITIKITKTESTTEIQILDNGELFDENLNKGYGLRSVTKKLQLLYPRRHEISFNNNPKHVLIELKNESND